MEMEGNLSHARKKNTIDFFQEFRFICRIYEIQLENLKWTYRVAHLLMILACT
jgi:hypothetical protein